MKTINITIDGESGGGKSTLAASLAKHYGILHLNSGALYRTITVHVLRNKINPESKTAVLHLLKKTNVSVRFDGNKQLNYLNGEFLDSELTTPEVSNTVAILASIQPLRDFVIQIERDIAKTTSLVLDGRDSGSVVLPDADVKIYLTASLEARAERRFLELKEKGINVNKEKLLSDMHARDESDRTKGGLKQTSDMILLDTSNLNRKEVVQAAIQIIDKRVKNAN